MCAVGGYSNNFYGRNKMTLKRQARSKIKKVAGKLKKASKAHARQSKILKGLLKNGKKQRSKA